MTRSSLADSPGPPSTAPTGPDEVFGTYDAREIARFKKVHTRIALKAGTPEAFAWKTGAIPDSYWLPFQAVVNLLEAGASVHVAAMTADPRFTSPEERRSLLDRRAAIHPVLLDSLEEETVEPYPVAVERLRHAGVHLD